MTMNQTNNGNADDDVAATAQALYREEVLRARLMRGEDKLCAGPELFDMACQVTMAGIRHQNPGISESEALDILRKRLALRRRSEWHERT